MSGLDDSDAEGDKVALLIVPDLFDVLRGVLLLDASCELLVARAEGSAEGVVLTGRTGAFEQLVEFVASEVNAETEGRHVRLLDMGRIALEAALAAQ